MKTYQGIRKDGSCSVRVIQSDGCWDLLDPQLKFMKHSPTGFEWGYLGSGPAQLAYAICHDAVGPATARRIHQQYKWMVVARLPHDGWQLTGEEVKNVIAKILGGTDGEGQYGVEQQDGAARGADDTGGI